jgi:hypothetical protein
MLFDQLKRRAFITLLGGAAGVWELVPHAKNSMPCVTLPLAVKLSRFFLRGLQ